MKFHVEGLNKKQLSVLHKLVPVIQQEDFYLGGGTALAIYFGHRVSEDLDWFTSNQMGDAMILAQSLRNHKLNFVTEQTAPGTLHGSISGVRITFLEFLYPLLKAPVQWKEIGCMLASLAYFDDAENERMPKMRWNVQWTEIKTEIQNWVKALNG